MSLFLHACTNADARAIYDVCDALGTMPRYVCTDALVWALIDAGHYALAARIVSAAHG